MKCPNPNCEQRNLTDCELLQMAIDKLRCVDTPAEIAGKMGAFAACAKCANIQIAKWLEELLISKIEKRREYENAMRQLFK